ncbi:MAG: hypothetical protein WBC51_28000 [Vicinamibacterales bacterium]
MRFGYLLTAAAIQLFVLFLPLAGGLVGLISGGLAGLIAVVGWFAVGIPLSYSAIDALATRQEHAAERSKMPSPAARIPSATTS